MAVNLLSDGIPMGMVPFQIWSFYLANFRLQYGKVKSSTSLVTVRPITGKHYGRLAIQQAVLSIIWQFPWTLSATMPSESIVSTWPIIVNSCISINQPMPQKRALMDPRSSLYSPTRALKEEVINFRLVVASLLEQMLWRSWVAPKPLQTTRVISLFRWGVGSQRSFSLYRVWLILDSVATLARRHQPIQTPAPAQLIVRIRRRILPRTTIKCLFLCFLFVLHSQRFSGSYNINRLKLG